MGCFSGDFHKEGLPLEWIGQAETQDLTAELVMLKKTWLKLVKLGRKAKGDECLIFRILTINDATHVEHLDIKKGKKGQKTEESPVRVRTMKNSSNLKKSYRNSKIVKIVENLNTHH